jgi:hypothetical protein
MDPIIRGFILGAITASVAALLGAIGGAWINHKLTIARELRSEKRNDRERFIKSFKIMKRRAYNLSEDIVTYKQAPHELSPIFLSFKRFKDSFVQFTEGIESDYLAEILSEDDYVAFGSFVARVGGILDTIEIAMRPGKEDFALGHILNLPLLELRGFTDKADKIVYKEHE